MKLKLDDDGNAVLKDGKPVYVADDGKEIEVDVPVLFKKVSDLNSESKGHRERAEAAEKTLQIFEGLDLPDLPEWKKKAEKAIETVKNYDDKQLVEAGKVEEIKNQMKAAHDEDKAKILASFSEKESAHLETIKNKDDEIYKLMVSSKFARSPLFSGENPTTVLLPEIAESYFGKDFKVEGGDNGEELRVVGYLGGEQIYSRKTPGELADFDEAIETIVDKYPLKDRILRSTGGGSGAGGGGGGGGGSAATNLDKLKKQYKEALDAGNTRASIAIKNQIWEAQKAT